MTAKHFFLEEVSKTKADFNPFVNLVIENIDFRKIVVYQLCKSELINIYYHSYLILEKVTEIKPKILYPYWNEFAGLLQNKNSYHRNYGMHLLANLVKVDNENRFEAIFENYYKQLNDEKISTKKYCIIYSGRIIKSKPELSDKIVSKIIKSLRTNASPEKHQDFLLSAFLELIISCKLKISYGDSVFNFINSVLENSKSKKIKKKITPILKKCSSQQM